MWGLALLFQQHGINDDSKALERRTTLDGHPSKTCEPMPFSAAR